jgi:hypothetical protein
MSFWRALLIGIAISAVKWLHFDAFWSGRLYRLGRAEHRAATTSNVLHHFPEDRYVAASLQLFSSVTLMFWYVLRIFMSRR